MIPTEWRQARRAFRLPASAIGATALVVMAGELHRDLAAGTDYFHGPRWWKALTLGVILLLVAQEAEKIMRDLD